MAFYDFNFTKEVQQELLQSTEKKLQTLTFDEALQEICVELNKKIPYYDWVGFYWASEKIKDTLELKCYVGVPTDHVQIAYGKGICGQVAVSKKTIVVEDVNKEANYIACSVDVKSEIVLPILVNDEFVGQLDIDSHALNAFGDDDTAFLTQICNMVADYLTQKNKPKS